MKYLSKFSKTQRAVMSAIFLSLSFALMGVWIRMMNDSFDTFQQSYLRILLAGLLAMLIFRKRLSARLFVSLNRREWLIYGLRAIMGYLFGVTVFTVAIQNADLGMVAFISALPLLGFLAFIMYGEKLPLASVPFLLLSMVGVLLLTGAGFRNLHFGIGEIAAIVSALGFNIGYLMARLHKKERNNFDNTTVLLLIGWIPVFVISVTTGESLLPDSISLVAFVGLMLSSIFNVVGLYVTNYVFKNLKAYAAGNILLLEGLWAAIMGSLLFGEAITVALVLGGALIVASAIAINRINNKDEESLIAELAVADGKT